jgi:photosystem II stability/assembly factor-like uncharacterized protein
VTAALILPHISFATTEGSDVRALAFDDGAVIAGSDAGLWRIADDQAAHLAAPSAVAALATHPARPGTVYAALRGGGLRRSPDGGENWAQADAGLPSAPILSLTAAAHDPDMLYAAVAGDGLWRSEDAGAHWEFVMDRPYLNGAEHDVLGLVSVGNPTGMGGIWLYAGTAAGLTRVPDCFCRWQDVTAGDAMDALAAGETPAAAEPLPAGVPVRSLALSPEAPERIYAGLESGLWASTDAGVNWSLVSPEPVSALAVDPADPLHIVAAHAGGLDVSRDGGARWTSITFPEES